MEIMANQRNYFVFDDKNSLDFGVHTNGYQTFNGAERDIDTRSVPKLNGEYLFDAERFGTRTLTYPDCFIVGDTVRRLNGLRYFLSMHSNKYYRLEDTYNPSEYYKAYFVTPFETSDITRSYNVASFDLNFNCKPQRYLKSGEEEYTLNNLKATKSSGVYTISGTINNPYGWLSEPVITFKHVSGTENVLTVTPTEGNASTITIESGCPSGTVTIECDSQYVFLETTDTNPVYVSISSYTRCSGYFPEISIVDTTSVKVTGQSANNTLSVVPNWFYV